MIINKEAGDKPTSTSQLIHLYDWTRHSNLVAEKIMLHPPLQQLRQFHSLYFITFSYFLVLLLQYLQNKFDKFLIYNQPYVGKCQIEESWSINIHQKKSWSITSDSPSRNQHVIGQNQSVIYAHPPSTRPNWPIKIYFPTQIDILGWVLKRITTLPSQQLLSLIKKRWFKI